LDLSADGRYLAFASFDALVPEACSPPPNGRCSGVYVYDRELATFELMSVGKSHSGFNDDIAISADGRFVTFEGGGLLVRDRLPGATASMPGGVRLGASISADGRFVAFDAFGVHVHDRDTDADGTYDEPGAVETILLDAQGTWPSLSDDGRFVAYFGAGGIVLHDWQNDTATIVALGTGGTAMDLSADGRYLAFATDVSLVPEDTDHENFGTDVYLYDRLTSSMQLLSVAKDGSVGNGDSAWGFPKERLAMIALTPDGRYAAFHSEATNFVPGEGAGVFVARTSVGSEADTDDDGCLDTQELGAQASLGGQRNVYNFWDFFDVWTGTPLARDRTVTVGDIGAVVARFGASRQPPPTKEEALAEALTPPPPAPAYHAAYDRGGVIPGQELWDLLPPDGSVTVGDIGAVVAQFGHSCAGIA